jgi:hypothetical protein
VTVAPVSGPDSGAATCTNRPPTVVYCDAPFPMSICASEKVIVNAFRLSLAPRS